MTAKRCSELALDVGQMIHHNSPIHPIQPRNWDSDCKMKLGNKICPTGI